MMSQPNFEEMNFKELRAYVLRHREDEAAFHAFVDKFHALPNKVEMPFRESSETAEKYSAFTEHLRKSAERYRSKQTE